MTLAELRRRTAPHRQTRTVLRRLLGGHDGGLYWALRLRWLVR